VTARRALALAALLVAAAGQADDAPARADDAAAQPDEAAEPVLRTGLLAEGTISGAHAERGVVALGGRLTLRLGPGAFAGSLDVEAEATSAQPRFSALLLFGPGLARDLSPHLGAHAGLVVGFEWLRIRDYVDGGWQSVGEAAAGARAGLEWRMDDWVGPRFHSGWLGQVGLAPVLGASATVVYAGTGSDRLRGIEWGGLTALLSLTLGAELASPPRALGSPAARAAAPPEPVPATPQLVPAIPEPTPAPRLPRVSAELVVGTSAGDGPVLDAGGRISWAPARRAVLSASWDAGEGDPRQVHHLATLGAGLRALRRGFVLEALALAGVHRIEEAAPDDSGWRAQDLPAAGVRVGAARAPRGAGVSFVYGASATVLASRSAESRVGRDDVGGVIGIAAASLGLAL
jgi:hypothetical protein